MIDQNHPNHFKSPHQLQAKTECTRLRSGVIDVVISDNEDLFDCWADRFHSLGILSQSTTNPALKTSERIVNKYNYTSISLGKSNNIFDSDLSVEAVEYVIRLLKSGWSRDLDGVFPEHINFSDPGADSDAPQFINHQLVRTLMGNVLSTT